MLRRGRFTPLTMLPGTRCDWPCYVKAGRWTALTTYIAGDNQRHLDGCAREGKDLYDWGRGLAAVPSKDENKYLCSCMMNLCLVLLVRGRHCAHC